MLPSRYALLLDTLKDNATPTALVWPVTWHTCPTNMLPLSHGVATMDTKLNDGQV